MFGYSGYITGQCHIDQPNGLCTLNSRVLSADAVRLPPPSLQLIRLVSSRHTVRRVPSDLKNCVVSGVSGSTWVHPHSRTPAIRFPFEMPRPYTSFQTCGNPQGHSNRADLDTTRRLILVSQHFIISFLLRAILHKKPITLIPILHTGHSLLCHRSS